jgi:enoyl-CoA hydratase
VTHLEVSGGIARLTFANPPVNSLAPEVLASATAALEQLEARDDWNVLALCSTQRVFSAGGDLQAMARWMNQPDPGAAIATYARGVQVLARRIEALPKPTAALCGGSALGGGLELALACDLRIASTGASFGLPEVGLGLLPGAGGTQRLTRLCGKATAMRLILGAEVVDASEARRLGIVQWVYPPGEFDGSANSILSRVASLNSQALVRSKACIRHAYEEGTSAGFEVEIDSLAALARTAATRNLVDAFLARGSATKETA